MNAVPEKNLPPTPPPSSPAAPSSPGPNPSASDRAEPPPLDSAPPDSPDATPTRAPTVRSPRGKIARLPKIVRDKLNVMLRDGVSCDDARVKLGDDAKDISARNISSWHTSPSFQHWLLEQEWLEDLRDQQESAFDLLTDFDTAKFNEAALQLAITRLFFALRHIDTGDLNAKLGGNARTFSGLVHALSRASREATNLEKYRTACAAAVAAELKQLNVDRDLSDAEYELLVKKMDQVFKVPRRPAQPTPKNGSP